MSKKMLSIQERSNLARKAKTIKRILPFAIGSLGSVIAISYVAALMYSKFGSFTVSVNQSVSSDYGIALCERREFDSQAPTITCRAKEEITNIDGTTLDNKDLGAVDGVDNGKDYICYTFYVKNTGKKTLTYTEYITIESASMGIEEAVRVRVMFTELSKGLPTTTTDYAWAKGVDEYGNPIPEDTPHETTPFKSSTEVVRQDVNNFAPGEINKYTVVIWLEGPDQDCIDEVIGGEFKIGMTLSVDGASQLEE